MCEILHHLKMRNSLAGESVVSVKILKNYFALDSTKKNTKSYLNRSSLYCDCPQTVMYTEPPPPFSHVIIHVGYTTQDLSKSLFVEYLPEKSGSFNVPRCSLPSHKLRVICYF